MQKASKWGFHLTLFTLNFAGAINTTLQTKHDTGIHVEPQVFGVNEFGVNEVRTSSYNDIGQHPEGDPCITDPQP